MGTGGGGNGTAATGGGGRGTASTGGGGSGSSESKIWASTAEPATTPSEASRLNQGVKLDANSRNDTLRAVTIKLRQCIGDGQLMTGPIHPLFYTVHGNIRPMAPTASLSIASMTLLRLKPVGKRRVAPLPLLLALGLSSPTLPIAAAELRREAIAQAGPSSTGFETTLQDDAYILGSGDGLSLRFLAVEDLSGPLEILNDGTASLPLLGSVMLSGLTLSQASLWLETLYKNQLQRPDLLLSVVRPRPLRIAVVGEVERPGLYTLTTSEASTTQASVSISGPPTLVDAIQKAGGITSMANLQRVVVQRRLPGADSRFKRTRVDLLALVRDGDQLQNPLLFDGDTIKLERVAQEDASNSAKLAVTTLAPTQITVNVIGEVKSPGRLQVPASTPLMQAILAAGGVETWRAKTSQLELVRINRNGSAMRRQYRLDYNQGVSTASNPPLVDGDTVIVNRSRYAISADAIGAVSQPLSGLVNVLTLFRLLDSNN